MWSLVTHLQGMAYHIYILSLGPFLLLRFKVLSAPSFHLLDLLFAKTNIDVNLLRFHYNSNQAV